MKYILVLSLIILASCQKEPDTHCYVCRDIRYYQIDTVTKADTAKFNYCNITQETVNSWQVKGTMGYDAYKARYGYGDGKDSSKYVCKRQ